MIEKPGTKEPKAEIENWSPMSFRKPKLYFLFCLLLTGFATVAFKGSAQKTSDSWTPSIPKAWDEAALAEWATPLAGLNARPRHISAKEYYALPVDNLRTYPVYFPGREPDG